MQLLRRPISASDGFRADFTSSVWNFCRWVADVFPLETSPAVKSEEKPLFSQARFLTSYSLELPGCRTNILVPLVSRPWLVIKTFIGIPYVIWRSWVQVVRTMTSCFSLMATPQLQVTPQQDQSRVCIFLKKTKRKKKDFSLPYKSTVVFNCLHFYKLKKRRRHRKNFPEKCLSFSAISFTQKGIIFTQ